MSSTQRAWIFEDALLFWAEHGVDRRHGGFFEELASALGWLPGAALSETGFDYLRKRARLPDGGWARCSHVTAPLQIPHRFSTI
jgi:mannose/cellobiose epimerase-like protein (N-acyl-D-glucosamine 2-epimerase family)